LILNYADIETEDLRMNNTGMLIYNAARIYYEDDDQDMQMISLIQHLDCNFLRSPKVWEHYFLFRINRKLIQQGTSGIEYLNRLRQRDNEPCQKGRQRIVQVQ
jgi:hypothetical protein